MVTVTEVEAVRTGAFVVKIYLDEGWYWVIPGGLGGDSKDDTTARARMSEKFARLEDARKWANEFLANEIY